MSPCALLPLIAACTDSDKNPSEVEIVSVSAETPTISQATVSAGLSGPASVAAACVSREDAAEVHLVEAEGEEKVDLRFSGLLAATDYDCSIVPTNPPGNATTMSFRTPDPPDMLPLADVVTNPSLTMTGVYTVMNVRMECSGGGRNYIVVLDPEGNNRWTYQLPAGMNIGVEIVHDGYNRFLWGGGKAPVGAATVVDVLDGESWKLSFPGSDTLEYHHEVNRISDGRVLTLVDDNTPGWKAFQLRLHDDDGSVSWMWDVQSATETGWLDPGSAESKDPHHVNWADVVDTERGLEAYASLCFDYKIVAIDVESGEPLWKLGYGGDFTLVDENGDPAEDGDDWPECQHGLEMDGTNLLVYDNGWSRGWTRAVEYKLDVENMTAQKTWEWTDEGFYEKYHGSAEWLTEDHQRVLVAEGNNDCGNNSTRHSQIAEVDRATGTVVHRLVLRDIGHWIYRAHRFDGCGAFSNARYCDTLATRLEELRGVLGM